MDTASTYAIKLLETIAENQAMLSALASTLNHRAEVTSTRCGFHSWKYPDEYMLEGFVNAELHNGQTIDWWMEVHWGEGKWLIQSEVFRVSGQGQQTIQEFPDRTAETFDDFLHQLSAATRELLHMADTIPLAVDS